MYNVSEAFKKAVYSKGTIIRPLIRFTNDNTFLTGEDIQLNRGLTVTEYFNTEEDLTIGCAPSSQLQTTLLNVDGLLNDYTYGECKVYLGAKVAEIPWHRGDSTCTAIFDYGTSNEVRFDAYKSQPYLKTNNEKSNVQPSEALQSILIYGNTLYGILTSGDVWVAMWDGTKLVLVNSDTWDDLKKYTWDQISDKRWIEFSSILDISDFMKRKLKRWKNRGLWYNSETCYEFRNNTIDRYEYVPLGVFIADTPEKHKTLMVNLTAQDRMKIFDQDATSWWNNLVWPMTVKQLFTQMCNYLKVPVGTTGNFINSARRFAEAPLVAETLTFREILKWIAGGAGGYARFNRDGYLELTWFGTQPINISKNQYFPDYEIAEYTVPKITGMQILNATSDIGVLLGNLGNVYQMIDNPIFYGATEDSIREIGAPVFQQLSSFATYTPLRVRAVCNWAIQAGDIIQLNNVNFPIFSQIITYTGGVRVVYQCTGDTSREILSTEDRRLYQQKRAIHQLQISVEGIQSHIEDSDNNISDLKLFAEGLTLSITNSEDGLSSSLSLKSGKVELSSGEIELKGLVSFKDLETAGKTTICGDNITTGQINANLITTGTLSADRISGGTINAQNITVTNLTADSITSGSFGSDRISSGAITNSKIGDLEITTDKLVDNIINNAKLNYGAVSKGTCNNEIQGYFADIIYANKVISGQVQATKLWAKTLYAASAEISGLKVAGNNITINGKTYKTMSKASATYVIGR